MIWIALHLPSLSLETFLATLAGAAADGPVALMDLNRVVVSSNAPARALGVHDGIKRSTALSLAPQLTLGQADAGRDAQALRAVAHAALAYTPTVTIAPLSAAPSGTAPPSLAKFGPATPGLAKPGLLKPGLPKPGPSKPGPTKTGPASPGPAAPNAAVRGEAADTVLLEVAPSLRYFGGLAALKERLHADLRPLGHAIHTVSAPTPLGAALLARRHAELHCDSLAVLHTVLAAAPVWLLDAGRRHRDALQGMGLHTLADLLALPRAGLAHRFGAALLDELDRAHGRCPDPREPISLPPVFESRLELFARADTTDQVLHGAGILLSRLVAWLSAQHAQVRRFTLVMAHEPRWRASQTPVATPLEIALAEPSRDATHLLALLRERLTQVELPAPTLELHLHCADFERRPSPNSELFPTPRGEQEGLTRLIERLQARLGPAQVQRLREVEDRRPERATVCVRADATRRPTGSAAQSACRSAPAPAPALTVLRPDRPTRPVWLLPEAEPLQEQGAGPLLAGRSLRLLSGPERIESGWWDCDLSERDYYIAQDTDGALLWIYRSRLLFSTPVMGWFLHGRFG